MYNHKIRHLKHGATNYIMAEPFMLAVVKNGGHARFISGSYMPFVVEYLHYRDSEGSPVFSFAHYGEQNGDAMRDPDMVVAVDTKNKRMIPVSYRNDYMNTFQEVFPDETHYRPGLLTDLDGFFWQWMKNIIAQGFNPETIEK